jgi:hypothetical protein
VAKYGADYSHILALLIQRAPTAGIAVQAILASWDIGMDRDSSIVSIIQDPEVAKQAEQILLFS